MSRFQRRISKEAISATAEVSRMTRARTVASAQTENFVELFKLSGLEPAKHCRFADWSGVSFAGCDLTGFDFTGASLVGCRFTGAKIRHAVLSCVEVGRASAHLADNRKISLNNNGYFIERNKSLFVGALDYHHSDLRPYRVACEGDAHLSSGAIFQDHPCGPPMAVFGGASIGGGAEFDLSSKPFAISLVAYDGFSVVRFANVRTLRLSDATRLLHRGYRRLSTRYDGDGVGWVTFEGSVSDDVITALTDRPYRLPLLGEYLCLINGGFTFSLGGRGSSRYALLFSRSDGRMGRLVPEFGDGKGKSYRVLSDSEVHSQPEYFCVARSLVF